MNQPKAQEYLAHCHCGSLSARYRTAVPISAWNIRACQCSFCRAHDALSVSDPAGSLEFSARRPEYVQRYRFGSGQTDFLICSQCGVYVGARLTSEPFGIINALALMPIPADLPAAQPMNYAGESGSAKRARRASSWTPLAPLSL
jgi:hypothetical protein